MRTSIRIFVAGLISVAVVGVLPAGSADAAPKSTNISAGCCR
jgi:hypothetical protein